MGRFDQWGRFGPANPCGSSYEPLTESTVSIFPPALWHRALILQRKNTTEKASSSPAFAFLTRLPKHIALISPSGRKQQPPWCCRNDREMNCECLHANMWVCRVITDANMSIHAEREREKQVFGFCSARIAIPRFIAVTRKCAPSQQSLRREEMYHVLQAASLDSYLVNIS